MNKQLQDIETRSRSKLTFLAGFIHGALKKLVSNSAILNLWKRYSSKNPSKPTYLGAVDSWSNLEIGHIFCNSKLVKIFKQEPLHNPHFYQILIHETFGNCGIILQQSGEVVHL